MTDAPDPIEAAIAALQAQRGVLGDAVVETALAPLRDKLARIRARSPGADQQLRSVTMLFMDVVGSTELARQLDPEDVNAVMDGALERFSAIVEAHQGRVLQYAGDSLLAAFGTREAHEDDAERAVHTGLAILRQAREQEDGLARSFGLDGFGVRVGIHTGTVLLGGGVDAGNTIRGVAVNVAARMEQTAPPGALRISHSTYRQVRGVFDVTEQPPIEVKGIAHPVRSYLVQQAKARAFRIVSRGVEGAETRMVGRDAEFARLTDAFAAMLEDRTVATLTLAGEAGIGKTRLMFEFFNWLELRPETLWYFQARARADSSSVPYGLLRDLFAWRFEIADSDAPALARAKLARGFGSLFGERAEEQTALIGQLIGLDYSQSPFIAGIAADGRQIRDRALHAAMQYFRLLVASGGDGIVMLLDDLQWADDGSLDFINRLQQDCRDLPLMVVALARPSLFERRPLWGSGQPNHERIALAPLTRRGSRELADELLRRLQPVPAALRELVTSSAEGNPYFIEELVAMLIDDGVIVTHTGADGEHWQVDADRLLGVHVPPTLAALLQARLDGLPPEERTTLQNASVIGHVFWDEPLARIEPESVRALDAVARRELAHCRETTAFEGTREFIFKHHLLHQVSYDSVLKSRKREQHRLAAEWLAARSAGRQSQFNGLIAEHYERAGDMAKAAVYLRQAGRDAARAYANAEALTYLGRALQLTPEAEHAARFDLLASRVEVLSNLGRRAEQEADVTALAALADTLADNALRARAAGYRASLAVATGNYQAATELARRAVAWADAAGTPGAALTARINGARALQFLGDAAAMHQAEEALALARQVGDHKVETAALNQLGIDACELGQYAVARGHYVAALKLSREHGDRALESSVLNNLGDIERYCGNHDAALELLQAGRKVCVEIGQRMSEPYVLCTLAQVAQARGDAAAALGWAGQAEAIAREVSDLDLQASIFKIQGDAHAAARDLAAADAAYAKSLATFTELGRTGMLAEPQAGLARVALAADRMGDALAQVHQIIGRLDAGASLDGTEDPLWILLTCHQVLAACGEPRAAQFLERAHALLMERASALDPPERATFLANVPSHRAIVQAFDAST